MAIVHLDAAHLSSINPSVPWFDPRFPYEHLHTARISPIILAFGHPVTFAVSAQLFDLLCPARGHKIAQDEGAALHHDLLCNGLASISNDYCC
jgi:hypothetical protein